MEKVAKIKTKDGHGVYGTLTLSEKSSDRLLIMIHGLTGFQHEHIFFNGAKFFAKNGINTFRFDLYPGGWKDARVLLDTNIKQHAEDLKSIIDYFKKSYKIYVAGHSLGGLTILSAELQDVHAVVLWDSSVNLRRTETWAKKFCRYIKALDCYVLDWGTSTLISKEMYRQWINFPTPSNVMPRIKTPIKIIIAGKNLLLKGNKAYFKYANKPKAMHIIKHADHTFDEEGAEEELFKETLSWIKKF